jgi:intein/homing endonuclease
MGTLVPTDQGLLAIEALSVGSVVRSLDPSGNAISAKVVETHKSIECGYYVINGSLRVTGTHPFFVDGQWIEVAELEVGDTLLGHSGPIKIASLERMDGVVRAYNITVDGSHTFLAGGVLVHNKPPGPGN